MANKFPVEEVSVAISRAAIKLRYSQPKAKQYEAVLEKHLEMKNIMERAEEYGLEESEAAMDESVSVPDSRDPESAASTMVEEEDRAVDSCRFRCR